MSHPDLGGPTPTENPSKLSMRKVLADHRPMIPNTNSAGTNKTSASRRDQTLITKGNRTERVSENKIEIGSLPSKTMEARRNLWCILDQLRLRHRERVGREHSGMLASATMLDWLSEPACVRTNRCEQKILRADLEVRRGHEGTAAPFRMGKNMAGNHACGPTCGCWSLRRAVGASLAWTSSAVLGLKKVPDSTA